ncbi:vWA domain-containing protein [Paenibacillus elgii]|uniref:vWA domain-containing protein n=1 Tax=Paenibacillus elgii TaxID=189691 RepID=UPI000FDB2FF8|nr:VWA domain-containing protein [Paenibacillus elgii]
MNHVKIIKALLRPAAALLLAVLMPLQAAAAPAGAVDMKMDAVLSVDVSTSMNESDVNKVSNEAMKMFVDMASVQGDKIGLVAYTDQVMREKALLPINSAADKQDLKSFIDKLSKGPYTDIAVGVSEAVKVLESGTEPGHVPLIVLMTDGNNSLNAGRTQQQSDQELNDAIKKAQDKGIPIYTIGLNADGTLNKAVLERISNETKGKSFITSTADNLPQILSEIYASHFKLKVVPLTGFVANGQFQDVKVTIPNASVQEANISIMSSKPVEVKLFDPSGKEQKIPSDRVVYTASSAYSLLKVLAPAQGDWKLQVKGVQKEKININLVYNYDLQLVMEPLASTTLKPGDEVQVKAYLQTAGQKTADADLYKGLKASAVLTDLDTKKTEEKPLTIGAQGIAGSFKVPDAHDYELKLKAEGTNFLRETAPVKLTAKSGGAASKPVSEPTKEAAGALSPTVWAAMIVGALVLAGAVLYALSAYRKANKGFVGQLVIEVKDEDTGERTNPQYRKLNAFKGKVTLHQLLQLAPEFAETQNIVFRPGPNDTVLLHNATPCVVEKGGRVFDAAKGKEIRANDRIKIALQNVNKSISVEYLK